LCETGETGPGNTVGPPAPGCGGTQPVVRQGESFRRRAGEGMSSLAGHARGGSGRCLTSKTGACKTAAGDPGVLQDRKTLGETGILPELGESCMVVRA
jgi:hypothetical protein